MVCKLRTEQMRRGHLKSVLVLLTGVIANPPEADVAISCDSVNCMAEIATSAKGGLAMTRDLGDNLRTSAAHETR